MSDPAANQNSQSSSTTHVTGEDIHWLVRPTTIKRLWQVFAILLSLTVLAQLFISVKGYVGVDGWFGFGAAFGFLACVAMVLFAKLLGIFLKRDQDYYRLLAKDTDGKDNV